MEEGKRPHDVVTGKAKSYDDYERQGCEIGMTHREEMREQYEDSLFRQIFNEAASTKGKELLSENERLQEDPTLAVPPELEEMCLNTIHKTGRNRRRKKRLCIYLAVLCILALIVTWHLSRPEAFQVLEDGTIYFSHYSETGTAVAELDAGKHPIRINVDHGEIDLLIEQNGMQILEGTFSGKNSFPIQVPENGEVSITITGRKASGKVQYQLVQR